MSATVHRNPNPVVRLCTTPEDREAVFRLRYDVYVAEMGRPQPHADHVGRRVTDELDDRSYLLGLFLGDTLLGTLRLHRVSDGVGKYGPMYGLDALSPADAARHAVVTCLMIDRALRGSPAVVSLFRAVYDLALRAGMDVCTIDCNDPLVPMFERFGFVGVGRLLHPLYGDVALMRLAMTDRAHLVAVASPFLSLLDAFVASPPPSRSKSMSSTPYLDRLRADFATVAETFHRNPACARMLSGDLSVQEYASLMASVSLQARENPQIQAYATAFFRGAQRDMVKLFYKHATSEIGHDQLAADDVAKLGFPVDDLFESRPRPGTVALTAFAYYTIDHLGPVAYLGYLFFLEYLPTQFGPRYAAGLDKAGVPADARTFLVDHTTIDVGHNKLMERYIETLIVDDATYDTVRYAMEVTARLYAHMIEEAFELAPTMTRPRARVPSEVRVKPAVAEAHAHE